MSQLFVDDVVSKEGTNSVGFSKGVNVSASSTITGNLNVSGVLTYEDVTNVDSVGIVTARGGIKLGAAGIGGTFNANGDTTLAGVVTATSFVGDGTGLTGMANTANVSTTGLNVVGVSTLSGNLQIGSGVTIGPAGVATFSGTSDVHLYDAVKLLLGNTVTGDCQLLHDGTDTFIQNKVGDLKLLIM